MLDYIIVPNCNSYFVDYLIITYIEMINIVNLNNDNLLSIQIKFVNYTNTE